jgi:hypothetical protein
MVAQREPMQEAFPAITHPTRTASSYAIGPIDPSQLLRMHAHLSMGEECALLVSTGVPAWIRLHPEFRDGYERSYESELEGRESEWQSVTQMVPHLYTHLCGYGFGTIDRDFGPWEVGHLLRDLTKLAETDEMLAYTGLAHLQFLLSFVPDKPPACWPPQSLIQAEARHDEAVGAYRARRQRQTEASLAFVSAKEPLPDSSPVVLLSALLAHPEFQQGVREAHEGFLGDYEPEPLTEDEMIETVERNLSRCVIEHCKKLCRFYGEEPISYLHNLGRVVGTIAQGLSYTQ